MGTAGRAEGDGSPGSFRAGHGSSRRAGKPPWECTRQEQCKNRRGRATRAMLQEQRGSSGSHLTSQLRCVQDELRGRPGRRAPGDASPAVGTRSGVQEQLQKEDVGGSRPSCGVTCAACTWAWRVLREAAVSLHTT
jgi:hypothetical protein